MEDIANLVFKKMKYLHIRRAVPDKLGYLISQYCRTPFLSSALSRYISQNILRKYGWERSEQLPDGFP